MCVCVCVCVCVSPSQINVDKMYNTKRPNKKVKQTNPHNKVQKLILTGYMKNKNE